MPKPGLVPNSVTPEHPKQFGRGKLVLDFLETIYGSGDPQDDLTDALADVQYHCDETVTVMNVNRAGATAWVRIDANHDDLFRSKRIIERLSCEMDTLQKTLDAERRNLISLVSDARSPDIGVAHAEAFREGVERINLENQS